METALNGRVTDICVTWGFRPVADVEQFHPKYIVNSVEELYKLLLP